MLNYMRRHAQGTTIKILFWIIIAVLHPPIGKLVDHIGTFTPALIAAGSIPLVGAAIGFLWPEPRQP